MRAVGITAAVVATLLVVGAVAAAIVVGVNTVAAFSTSTDDLELDLGFDDGSALPAPPQRVGYSSDQLANACTILAAGRDLGFGDRDRTIAVMTAMGESSLRNIDYGDWETSGVTNPDGSRTTSIGLFQQQDNWGSREQRLDPYTAATLFYRAMAAKVPDRDALEPTQVAHRVQINADAGHYARYWDRAVQMVAALSGAEVVDGMPACG